MTWETVPLGSVAELNPRATGVERNLTFLGMADLGEDGRTTDGTPIDRAELRPGYTPFANGDILFAKITPCFENGKIGQATIPTSHGYGSTEFHVARPAASRLDARYLHHFLRSPEVRATGEVRMTGSAGQRRVPLEFLRQLRVPLPPLPEQRRIAAILDEADALRADSVRQRALAHEYVRVAFDALFSANGWTTTTIGELLTSAQYGTSAKAGPSGAFPILRMGNITADGRIDLTDMKFIDLEDHDKSKFLAQQGDILFNRTNSADLVGKAAVYREPEPRAYAGYLVRLRPKTPELGEYISGFLNSRHGKRTLRKMAKSIVGMANINAREVQSIRLPQPGSDSLAAYAQTVEDAQALSAHLHRRTTSLGTLFASLQHRAFRGEL